MSLDRQITHQNRFRESVYDVYKWSNGEQHSYILGQETRSSYCPDSKHNIVRRETIGRPICEYLMEDLYLFSLFVICLWGPKCFHPFLVPSPGVSWERISPSVWSLLTCLSQIHLDFVFMGVCGFDSILYECIIRVNELWVNWSPWQIFGSISFRSDKTRQP